MINYHKREVMSDHDKMKRRILAILDYDEVDPRRRLQHLMQRCGLSRYMAKRALCGYLPSSCDKVFEIVDALDVSVSWLWAGEIKSFHPRTFRIHAYTLNYPKRDIDQMSRLMMALVAGQNKAKNLADLICKGALSLPAAAQLM